MDRNQTSDVLDEWEKHTFPFTKHAFPIHIFINFRTVIHMLLNHFSDSNCIFYFTVNIHEFEVWHTARRSL